MNNNESKVEQILLKIGLTLQESRVYICLLELQEAQTGNLCKFVNIASSNIYNILDSLIRKGLVSYRVQNNIKIFMPASPDVLNELFLEKQKKIDEERKEIAEVITNLKRREVAEPAISNYKYYEGFVGIKSMWYEIRKIMSNKTITKIHTARKGSYERLVGFYTEYHKERVKKNIKIRMIFPREEVELAKKRKNKHTEIRFMKLKNEAEWGVMGDKIFIQYITTKQPRAFLIKDEVFAKTFEQVFDKLWEKAEEKKLR